MLAVVGAVIRTLTGKTGTSSLHQCDGKKWLVAVVIIIIIIIIIILQTSSTIYGPQQSFDIERQCTSSWSASMHAARTAARRSR
jgi:hypothetical protein